MKTSGQSSLEFLLIVAFSLAILIPASVLFLNYTSSSQDAVISSQLFSLARELSLTADLISSIGVDSWQTIEVIVPPVVNEIVLYSTPSFQSDLVIRHGSPESTILVVSDAYLVNASTFSCSSGCVLPVEPGLNKIRVQNILDNGISYIRLSVVS